MREAIIGILVLGCAVALACEGDDDDDGGLGGSGGSGGSGAAGAGATGGSGVAGGEGGRAGAAASCQCESETGGDVRLSFECACDGGLCRSLEQELELVRTEGFGGVVARFGRCEQGVFVIEWRAAFENGGVSHYNAEKQKVYDRSTGYLGGFGFKGERLYGCPRKSNASYKFGEPLTLTGCDYCLLRSDRFGEGGAGGEGSVIDPRWSDLPECELMDGVPVRAEP